MSTTGRKPEATAPRRIEPLATLPLFHKLDGRRVVLAGGSDGALWKAELLAATGAEVLVLAGEDADPAPFEALAGRLRVLARGWQPDDLDGAALAIADVETDEEATRFVSAARAAGVPVNVVDKPAFCDFQFGAIVNRSPLIVSISTDGAAPVFGQAIRAKIEGLLPRGFKAWAQAAKDWRPAVQERNLGFAERRRFWERFTERALGAADRVPDETDRGALMAGLSDDALAPRAGRVTLVGAGPGDPELLTLKAVRALQSADVILYDDLVSAEVLELARREAKRMLVGKTGHRPSCRQDDINETMVSLARQGRHVVRLKSGDPSIFGRAGEEIDACRQANIPVTIVPGISAAQGAAASLGVSLTHRDHARRLQFVTGHARDGALPADLDWQALADPAATTAIYMPKGTLAAFAEAAIAAGLAPDTPAVAVIAATRPAERRIVSTIAALPAALAEDTGKGPALVLVGRALALADASNDVTHETLPPRRVALGYPP